MMKPDTQDINNLIQLTLKEDCPSIDVTTKPLVPDDAIADFQIIAKEELVSCGAFIAKEFFLKLDSNFEWNKIADDGSFLHKGDVFLSGRGPVKSILTAERGALNIVQRLSGISTMTAQFVEILKGTQTKVLDTRKTTPGLRIFEKYAVSVGGGRNHRFCLSDMVLLKENHLKYEEQQGDGYIERAIKKCRALYKDMKIEIEIRFVSQADEAASAGADIIMLDNMSFSEIEECINIINKRSKVEVSGGITLESIRSFALPGVDYISVGALTHSVKSSDLSLLIIG